MSNIDELHDKWWDAKVKFSRIIMAIDILLEYDDIESNILEHLHEIADLAEANYMEAFNNWLEELEKKELEVADIQGTA